jgi:enoyl-CoA hydratase/carnithine racemase
MNPRMQTRADGAQYVTISSPQPAVRLITLNNPERLNAMGFPLVESLYAALAEVGADNGCSVAILTGAGRGFCSGMDLTDVGMPPGSDGLPVSRIAIRAMAFMSDIVPAMRAIPQPLIAAINGASYGGGMCLPLGCDIRIAARSATFRGAGINNGLTGTECGVSFLLPRLIGASRANEIILSGREVGADEAERRGRRCAPAGRRRARSADVRLQHARPLDDQGSSMGESRGLQPQGRHRPREPQPAPRPHDDAEPRRGHPGAARRPPARLRGLNQRTESGFRSRGPESWG